MNRREAFRVIRDVCGPEICPTISAAQQALMGTGRDDLVGPLGEAAATAHQMRQALKACVVLLTSLTDTCPNCERPMEDHNAKCSVGRMLG